ncbi:MAG: ABC transporter ATP-binding protein, partial [Gaiellaceae bacterium]
VAAHLDPEVLLIDEVLAVGDFEFQQRCMGRIEDISQSGRTVIFVSHDMQAISRLCDRAYQLDKGRVVRTGPAEQVVGQYLQEAAGAATHLTWDDVDTAPGNDLARIVSARVVDDEGRTVDAIDVRRRVGIEIGFAVLRTGAPVFPTIKVTDARGQIAFNALDTSERWRDPAKPGRYLATAWIPSNLLNEGLISVDVGVGSFGGPKILGQAGVRNALTFQVQDLGVGDSAKGLYTGQLRGVVRPLLEWTTVSE